MGSFNLFCFFIIIFHVFVATPIFSHSSSSISTKFLDLAKSPEVFDWMVGIRRKIHEYPELSYEEFKTSEVIRAELDKMGISYKHPVAETGVIGYIGTRKPPFVALRADIDGLPIQEMVEWEHKSKVPGKMHACGHDAHTAMVLGAAKILKQHEDQIKGTVVLVFQPAEEGGGGAKRVLEAGVLDKVSAIFGLHVAPVRELPVGHVASKAGPLLAGTAMFDATIHGKGGHAAMPHFAIDPVLAASSAVVNLQQLVSREADPLDPQVLTVANFHADGAYNVIPDSVTFGGTIRALLPESIARLKERIHQEMVEWEHKSKVDGKMHACGHDAHTAMVLGAAKILKHHEDQIKGTVVLVFQPAEEGGAGAKRILEAGVLDKVSAIFGLHVAPAHDLPVGHVASKAGPLLAGSGMFDATIHGKGGHAAMPHFAIDPVLAASSAVVNLQQLVSREADPLDPQVVTVTNFHGDGAFNVIPDSVTIGGTFRAFSPESITRLKDRIHQVITGQAAVHRCTAEVDFHEDKKPLYPATINDDKLHEHFLEVAKNVVGNKNVHEMQPVTVSEDFSFYQEALPGYFFMLGMKSHSGEPLATLHSPHFTVNEDALPYGAALHASLATTYLLNHDGANKVGGKYHDEL
ncbi:IAA-amino acid hydrolase ILR1-like 4 isoform X1 [Arachis hypogaea]|uniref:IAA-amino acid hydrolase ILR1-like 4 isoform X1 n=1 Tax=Arachis hypogaea TaxID=3818 RepID=UPI003B220D3A